MNKQVLPQTNLNKTSLEQMDAVFIRWNMAMFIIFFFFPSEQFHSFCVKDILQNAAGEFTNKQRTLAIMFKCNDRPTLTFTHSEVQLDHSQQHSRSRAVMPIYIVAVLVSNLHYLVRTDLFFSQLKHRSTQPNYWQGIRIVPHCSLRTGVLRRKWRKTLKKKKKMM